jgi:hypothetical protein
MSTTTPHTARHDGVARRPRMLWLTWRQHRLALVAGLVAIALLLGWMVSTGIELHGLIDAATSGNDPRVKNLRSTLQKQQFLVLVVPLVVSLFWGAPLVAREHEQRTPQLIWTQDVTPTRWLLVKVGLLGTVLALATAALSAVNAWAVNLESEIHQVNLFESVIWDGFFETTVLMPVVYSLAAFALGVAAGAVVRRVVPALAITVIVYAGLFVSVSWLRSYYLPPLRFITVPFDHQGPPGPNALHVVGSEFSDATGNPISMDTALSRCHDAPDGALTQCLVEHGVHDLYVYQPGSRLPVFHLIEAGVFVVVTALAVLAAWRWVRAIRVVQ